MTNYINYKEIRAKVVEILETNNISTPDEINIASIAKSQGITNINLTRITEPNVSGFITAENGRFDIHVNQSDVFTRQRFTVAHELAHKVLGHLDDIQTGDQTAIVSIKRFEYLTNDITGEEIIREAEADAFAGEILVPFHMLKKLWQRGTRNAKLLANEFFVSEPMMHKRLSICLNELEPEVEF